MLTEIQSVCLKHLFSTEPSDRPRAEAAFAAIYSNILKLPPPKYFFWFDSPERAGWAVKLLESPHEKLWQSFVDQKSSTHEGRLLTEDLRDKLCTQAGLPWEELTKITGLHRTQQCPFNLARVEAHGLMDLFLDRKRSDRLEKVRPIFAGPDENDEIRRLEEPFFAVIHQYCGVLLLLRYNMQSPYTFAMMAEDQHELARSGRQVPTVIQAAWDLARSTGACWVFQGAVVLLERPAELRFDQDMLLHCEDGPAGMFRDGTKIWAWHGGITNEEFLLHPESIRPERWRELEKEANPRFVAFMKERRAAAGKAAVPSTTAKVVAKSSKRRINVFAQKMSASVQDRIDLLRQHAGGSTPMLDRYLAGDHRAVWSDLVALGAAVREEAHAADALAVAYETMRRVDANVRTVSARLTQLGFTPGEEPLHTPPNENAPTQIRELEEVAGTVPISLRAFYEIVGAVNWNGQLAGVLPSSRPQPADPLVVMPIEIAIESADYFTGAVLIAPDDLTKADTSGGDPYQIEVPNASADAVLRFECHYLNFVDYLRLAFRFGGFPGYDGMEFPPPRLAELSIGLLPF